jgi:hypothetical protein
VVEAGGDSGDPIGGYSILQAESQEALAKALEGHPHLAMVRSASFTNSCTWWQSVIWARR